MTDDQERCKLVNVSSATGSPGQPLTKGCKTTAAAAAALEESIQTCHCSTE